MRGKSSGWKGEKGGTGKRAESEVDRTVARWHENFR